MAQVEEAKQTKPLAYVYESFLIVSIIALGLGVHCVLTASFTAIWGPGLALRGPRGSVTKAYATMRKYKHTITFSFSLCVIFFFLQAGVAIWLVTARTMYQWGASAMLLLAVTLTTSTLWKMHGEFYLVTKACGITLCSSGKRQEALVDRRSFRSSRHSSASVRADLPSNAPHQGDLGLPLLGKLANHPDISNGIAHQSALQGGGQFRPRLARPELEGRLGKRAKGKSFSPFAADKWHWRYFRLSGTSFCYWKTQEDFDNGVPPCKNKIFSLRGIEVQIDPEDPLWGFSLKADASSWERSFDLRAETEPDRVKWVESFVAACLLAADDNLPHEQRYDRDSQAADDDDDEDDGNDHEQRTRRSGAHFVV